MSEQNIDIKFTTTADTTGAKEAEKSIFAASEAAEEANRQADVDAVRAKQLAEAQREQATALAEVATQAERLVAANLADAIGKIGGQFKGLSPEVDLVVTSAENFLNVFASTGDPIKATLAVVGTAIGSVVTAYQEAETKVGEIAKKEEDHLQKMGELRQKFADQVRKEGLEKFFSDDLAVLIRTQDTLENINRIGKSERDLGAGRRERESEQAVKGGAAPEAEAAKNIVGKVEDGTADILSELQVSAGNVETLRKKANQLTSEAGLLIQNSDEQIAKLKEADAARVVADRAVEKLKADSEIAANRIKDLVEQGGQDTLSKTEEQFTRIGRETATKLEKLASAPGAVIDESYRQARASIDNIFKDQKVTLDEIPRLEAAFRQMAQSVLANTQGTQEILGSTVRQLETARTQNLSLIQRLESLERDLRNTNNRVEGLPFKR